VDDGARELADSLAMVRMAASHGTGTIVASPHASPEYAYDEQTVDARIAEISAAAPDGPKIVRGCDFHLSFENIQQALVTPRKFTIGGKCYLLVEFPDLAIFPNTGDIFERLMDNGMIPVITHPERNQLLQQKIDDIAKWVERGTVVQVTAGSLLGRWGNHARQFSETLMKRRLVHCIASDAHDIKHRPPILTEAREHIEKQWGKEMGELLTVVNPGAIVEGREIERTQANSRKWYRFW
jgi:protein-tyrosine phosphatase